MKILSLSDTQVSFIYSPQVRTRFGKVDLIVGCGDLAYAYLEYVLDALDAPLYFVRGNHDKIIEYTTGGQRTAPHGAVDLHCQVRREQGLLLAGVEGSLRYRPGRFQYSQAEMWGHVLRLTPGLIANRARFGRYLDLFVTHAPAAGIHDADDLPHHGIQAFRWLVQVFKPAVFLHGHIHITRPDAVVETQFGPTRVINTYGFRELTLAPPV